MERKDEKPEQTASLGARGSGGRTRAFLEWLRKVGNLLNRVPTYGYVYLASLLTFPLWGTYPLVSLIPVATVVLWRGRKGWPIVLSLLLLLLALHSYREGIFSLTAVSNLDRGFGYLIVGYFSLLLSVRLASWYVLGFRSRYYWFGEVATVLSLFLPPLAMLYVMGAPFVGGGGTRPLLTQDGGSQADGDVKG